MLPAPPVSHVLVIVGPNNTLVSPHLVRAVPLGEEDDTRYRLNLMSLFVAGAIGETFPLTKSSQVWDFWEKFALPSGYRIATIEAQEPRGNPQPEVLAGADWGTEPTSPPGKRDEPPEIVELGPTTSDIGHA